MPNHFHQHYLVVSGYLFPPVFPPLSIHFLIFCFFLLFPFPFLIRCTYFFLLSISSLSTRIIPLRFQAGGHRRRPNLGLVCSVHFVLYLLLSKDLFWCFCYICFSLVLRCDSCHPLL